MSNETIIERKKSKHRTLRFLELVFGIGTLIYCILILAPYIFVMGGHF